MYRARWHSLTSGGILFTKCAHRAHRAADPELRNPTRGAGCCARAATGHAAAAPPSSVINWRLVAWTMGSPPEPVEPAYPPFRLPWKDRQVLGLSLNCSESRHPVRLARFGVDVRLGSKSVLRR